MSSKFKNKKQDREFETLLSDLNEKNLIHLQELKSEGWQVHYILDADLVAKYCFPEGILKPRIIKGPIQTDEYRMDEQATLYNLFETKASPPQRVVLDEYIAELRGMMRVAIAAEKERGNKAEEFVNKWLAKSREEEKMKMDIEELTDDIRHNFSLRLAEVLFGIKGLSKLHSLLTEGKLEFENGEKISGIFRKLFDEEKGDSAQISKIFDVFSKQSEGLNVISRSRDSQAMQRIIAMNRALQALPNAENRKHILVFVTNPQSVALDVFSKLIESNIVEFPMYKNRKMPIFMTTHEVFAHLISKVTDSEGNEDCVKTLEKVRSLAKLSVEIKKIASETADVIAGMRNEKRIEDMLTGEFGNFFINYKQIRNTFENTGLFENTIHIYEKLKKSLKERKTSWLLNYFKEISQNENKILKELKDRGELLESLNDEAQFNFAFITGIEEVMHRGTAFAWSKGLDPIEGTYQILPMFLRLKNYSGFATAVNKVIKLVLGDEIKNDRSILEALDSLIKTLKTTKAKPEYETSQRLLKAVIFLLLPDLEEQPTNHRVNARVNNKDKKVFEWLKSFEDESNMNDFEADYWYILCWVCRRMKSYGLSANYAERGRKRYPTDPRFYHGLALAQYCDLLERKEIRATDYDNIIKNIDKAESLYPEFFGQYYSTVDQKTYMDKIVASNNNNICDFLSEKALILINDDEDYESAYKYLTEARKRLNRLKNAEKKAFLVELPEYYDTEAILEYSESFLIDDFDPKTKLVNALGAINKARLATNNQELTEKYYKRASRIQDRLNFFEKKK